MFVNVTKAPIILGRFRILPREKMPPVPLTDQEQAGFDRLKKKGMFKEDKAAAKPVAAPKPVPAAAPPKSEEPKPAQEPIPTEAPVEAVAEAPAETSADAEADKAARRNRPAGK